jgi:hypothetical protein
MTYYDDMQRYGKSKKPDQHWWERIFRILEELYEHDNDLRRSGQEYKSGISGRRLFRTFGVSYKTRIVNKIYMGWLIDNNLVKEQEKSKFDTEKTRRYYITQAGREYYEKYAVSFLRILTEKKEQEEEMIKAAKMAKYESQVDSDG